MDRRSVRSDKAFMNPMAGERPRIIGPLSGAKAYAIPHQDRHISLRDFVWTSISLIDIFGPTKAVLYTKVALRSLQAHRNRAKQIRAKIEQYAAEPAALANNVIQLRGS